MAYEDLPLNEEQRELAAQNHNLIYSFAHSHYLDLEEFYDILAIALCIAAREFDPNRGCKFSSYAYRVMTVAVCKYFRDINAASRIPIGSIRSINEEIVNHEGAKTELIEVLEGDFFTTYIDETTVHVQRFLETLNVNEKYIVFGLLNGYREQDLARYLHYTRANISRIKVAIARKYLLYNRLSDAVYKKQTMKEMKKTYADL